MAEGSGLRAKGDGLSASERLFSALSPRLSALSLFLLGLVACSRATSVPEAPAPVRVPVPASTPVTTAPADSVPVRKPRVAPPQVAFQVGLMPLASTGMSAWRLMHPTWDGRGVLIAVLDGGVDPGVQGLLTTSTGEPKILDVRDLSGENDVPLEPVRMDAIDRLVLAGGIVLTGLAGVRAAAQADAPWYAGVVIELPLGKPPYADLNGNGNNRDRFGVVVVRTAGRGWVAFVDTNGDGARAAPHPQAA